MVFGRHHRLTNRVQERRTITIDDLIAAETPLHRAIDLLWPNRNGHLEKSDTIYPGGVLLGIVIIEPFQGAGQDKPVCALAQ
jgi:hypothetical protein